MFILENIGDVIGRAREKAGLKQGELARRMGVDASRLSRIEKGEMVPSDDEVERCLKAIGGDLENDLRSFFNQKWVLLARPDPWHPERRELWDAEQSLQALGKVEANEEFPAVLSSRVAFLRARLKESAAFLGSMEHNIAFIGDVGIGKTTALCLLTNLITADGKGTILENVALSTGGGRNTLCEVHVRTGPDFGLIVEPQSDREIYDAVNDLCAGLIAKRDDEIDPESEKGVGKELDRALRNMAGLVRKSHRSPDGKRIRVDPAREIIIPGMTLAEVRSEFAQRLTLWKRTQREIWFDHTSKQSGLAWIRETFGQVNFGQHPDFSLPRRVTIIVPHGILASSDYQISVVDTKGMDETALRPDLKDRIDDSRTVSIFCSSFNDAPSNSLKHLLQDMVESGSDAIDKQRVVILILPRSDEALKVRDDSGEMPETVEEGYDIKSEHVESALGRNNLPAVPTFFFNGASEKPDLVWQEIINCIDKVRQIEAKRILAVADEVRSLIENFQEQQVRETQLAVIESIERYIARHEQLEQRLRPAHSKLIESFRSGHVRSVWASMNRRGEWHNFPLYFYLGVGVETEINLRTRQAFEGLYEILGDILDNIEMQTAHKFVESVKDKVNDWRQSFLKQSRHIGEEVFRPDLEADNTLWSKCDDRYGRGSGYKSEIAEYFNEWFEQPERAHLRHVLESRIHVAWQSEFLAQLRSICREDAKSGQGEGEGETRAMDEFPG